MVRFVSVAAVVCVASACGRTAVFDDPASNPCSPASTSAFAIPAEGDDAHAAVAAVADGFAVAWSARTLDGGSQIFLASVEGRGTMDDPQLVARHAQDGDVIPPALIATGEGLIVAWVEGAGFIEPAAPWVRLYSPKGEPLGKSVLIGNADPRDRRPPALGWTGKTLVAAWDLGALSYGSPDVVRSIIATLSVPDFARVRDDQKTNYLVDVKWRAFQQGLGSETAALLFLEDEKLKRLSIAAGGDAAAPELVPGDLSSSGVIEDAALSNGGELTLIAAKTVAGIDVYSLDRTGPTQAATTFEVRPSTAFHVTGAKTGAWLVALDEDEVLARHSRGKDSPPTALRLGKGKHVVTAARGADSLAVWSDGTQIRGAMLRCQ